MKYLCWKGWNTWAAWFTSHSVGRQRFSSHLCRSGRRYRRALRARWWSHWMTLQDSTISYLTSKSIIQKCTRSYILTSQAMFHVWFNIKSGEVRLRADLSCIFSLKFSENCVPRSFKQCSMFTLKKCISFEILYKCFSDSLCSYSFLSTAIFWLANGYIFTQQTSPQCARKHFQYPTHKNSDLLYFLTNTTFWLIQLATLSLKQKM